MRKKQTTTKKPHKKVASYPIESPVTLGSLGGLTEPQFLTCKGGVVALEKGMAPGDM